MTIPKEAITKPETGVSIDTLQEVGRKSVEAPDGIVSIASPSFAVEVNLNSVEI